MVKNPLPHNKTFLIFTNMEGFSGLRIWDCCSLFYLTTKYHYNLNNEEFAKRFNVWYLNQLSALRICNINSFSGHFTTIERPNVSCDKVDSDNEKKKLMARKHNVIKPNHKIWNNFFSSTINCQSGFVKSSRKYSLQASMDSRDI